MNVLNVFQNTNYESMSYRVKICGSTWIDVYIMNTNIYSEFYLNFEEEFTVMQYDSYWQPVSYMLLYMTVVDIVQQSKCLLPSLKLKVVKLYVLVFQQYTRIK